MADNELDTKYVEEAPDNGAPHARQTTLWVEAFGKEAMLEFVTEVKANASAAESASASAHSAAQATATDVAKTAQSVKDAKQHSDTSAAQVPIAQAAQSAASLHAQQASVEANRARTEANRAASEADRALAIVDEFNPGINQYGYSKVLFKNVSQYFVTAADVGKTLVFDRPAVVVLPASGREAFPSSFFFHVTTLDPMHDLWIDYDLATTLTMPKQRLPKVEGATRGTIQLLDAGKWRLFDPLLPLAGVVPVLSTTIDGQSRGQVKVADTLNAAKRIGLVKQYSRLYAWQSDLISGKFYSANADAAMAADLPDGPLSLVYSSASRFDGKLLYGVTGGTQAGITHFGWFWCNAGFTSAHSPLTIDGHMPSDWYIADFQGEFSGSTKHAWVELVSRTLVDGSNRPIRKSLLLSSTDGFSWYENRYSNLNPKLSGRKVIAHFVFTQPESGELYLLEADGQVTQVKYSINAVQWVERNVADGFDRVVQQKSWASNGDYVFAFIENGQLHLFAHNSLLPATLENHTLTDIESAVSIDGDAIRSVELITRARDTNAIKRQLFGGDLGTPNGALVTTAVTFPQATTETLLVRAGAFVGEGGAIVNYLLGTHGTSEVWMQAGGVYNLLPWQWAHLHACGGVVDSSGLIKPTVATDLGLFVRT